MNIFLKQDTIHSNSNDTLTSDESYCLYDNEILTKTYEKNGCNYSKLEEYDETKRNALLKQLDLLNFNYYGDSISSDVYQKLISDTILKAKHTHIFSLTSRM